MEGIGYREVRKFIQSREDLPVSGLGKNYVVFRDGMSRMSRELKFFFRQVFPSFYFTKAFYTNYITVVPYSIETSVSFKVAAAVSQSRMANKGETMSEAENTGLEVGRSSRPVNCRG